MWNECEVGCLYFSDIQFYLLIFAFTIVILSFIKVNQIKKEYLIKHRELEVEFERIELERQKIKVEDINGKVWGKLLLHFLELIWVV